MCEFIFACIGASVCVAFVLFLVIRSFVFLVRYVPEMRNRYSARRFYKRGREDEKLGKPDYFADQPRPSFRPSWWG